MPWRIHGLFFLTMFASYGTTGARTVVTRVLANSPRELRDALAKLSSKSGPGELQRQRRRNCVRFGLRNTLCVYDGHRQSEEPLYEDQYIDEEYGFWPNLPQPPSNGHGGFVDLTRLNKDLRDLDGVLRSSSDDDTFSEDYLDVGDLSATRKVDYDYVLGSPKEHLTKLKLHIVSSKQKGEKERGGLVRKLFNLETGPGASLRTLESELKDASSEEEFDDGKPKRFEVIENSDESEESSRGSEERPAPKKVKGAKGAKYIYAQGPTRHVTVDRRRLPHFLPKRYHWDEGDIRNLSYLWFNGPQGQYAGVYRKPL
ncbi:unnamed protein product, partial [Iphiclides podalirius]